MSILYRKKKWLTFAQLVPAWATELARAEADRSHLERDLGHSLLEDMINGRLDNVGPLVDGRRLGLRIITPENKAGFLEGHHVRELTAEGTPQALSLIWNRLVVLKEAVLDFARRHELPPPSWWPVERERLLSEAGERDADAQLGVRRSEDWRTEKPNIFAGAPAFARGSERIRQTIVTTMIRGSRTTGDGRSDEEIFAKAELPADEYWHVAVSEPMGALSFVDLLASHLLDPTTPVYLVNMSIEKALCLALKMGETWFIKDPHTPERGPGDLKNLMLHPRAAAEWLLSLPMQRHLVPPGLKAFLEADRKPAQISGASSPASDGSPVNQPKRSQAKSLKPAPKAIVIEAIKSAYNAADAAGGKPPNIKELPTAVHPLLEEKGFSASGRFIQQLGEAEEFKHRRRPPGKTVSSEQRQQRK